MPDRPIPDGTATPAVTVVIPTHDRRDMLERLLQALADQEDVEFDVIVVDDCSTDGTWDFLQDRARRGPLRLTPERTETNSGPATARNIGWRRSRTPLVAFVDDDCVPAPGWLKALVAAADGVDVVQGATLPFPDQAAGRGPFARFVWVDRDFGRYETCNIAYRRELLTRLGGFDETFRTVGGVPMWGEDTDLGWRAKELGATIRFEPTALAHCQVYRSDYPEYLRQLRRRGGLVRNIARHPGLRRHYPLGAFMQVSHPFSVLALAGGAAALARPRSGRAWLVGLALAAPYVSYRTIVNPWTCRPRNLVPVLALGWVADLADTAELAAASVRYRTFFI